MNKKNIFGLFGVSKNNAFLEYNKLKSEVNDIACKEKSHLISMNKTRNCNNKKRLASINIPKRAVCHEIKHLPPINTLKHEQIMSNSINKHQRRKLKSFQNLERREWYLTDAPTALRLYISYYAPRIDPLILQYVDDAGNLFVRESQRKLVHGMILNKEGRSFYPPIPPMTSPPGNKQSQLHNRVTKCMKVKSMCSSKAKQN